MSVTQWWFFARNRHCSLASSCDKTRYHHPVPLSPLPRNNALPDRRQLRDTPVAYSGINSNGKNEKKMIRRPRSLGFAIMPRLGIMQNIFSPVARQQLPR